MSETALKHIEHLSVTIGPRGAATPEERQAHDHVEQTLAGLGLAAQRDPVTVWTSPYRPFILALALMLVAVFLFANLGGAGALAATVIGGLATASALLELAFKDNPLRWFLPVSPSQNVYAVAEPAGEPARKIVVVAHVDTHRTPLIWSSPGTFQVYRILSTLGIVGLPAGVALFAVGIFVASPTLRAIAAGLAVLYGLLLLVALQAEFTEFTRGANDNASGVGVLLALAERLKREPLARSRVWLLASTAEEPGGFGMQDFLQRHKAELDGAVVLNVDNIAGKETAPCYLRSEMLLKTLKYPPDLLALAEAAAAERPELGARPHAMQGTWTDAGFALDAGYKALSLVGFTKDGWIPLWHHPDDELEYLDQDALDRAEQFTWELVQRLDRA
jgi:hypothetical protein